MLGSSRRLILSTVRPALSRATPSLAPKNQFFVPPIGYAGILVRTYAVKRGAASRPVKVQEPIPRHTPHSSVAPHATQDNNAFASSQSQQAEVPYVDTTYGGQTAGQIINSSVSVQAFLRRAMTYTAVGVGVTAVSTVAFMQIPFVLMHPYISLGVGVVGTLGCLVGMNMSPPTYVREGEIVKAVDTDARKAMFGGFLVAQGLTMAPMLYMVAHIAPMAIPVAAGLAAGTMAGMAAYAIKQPQGSLAKWGPALSVGIFGLIGVGIVNLFVQSSALTMAMSIGGIGVFAAFTAYDVHMAIQEHNEGRPDHMLTAANFYLNFVNLFLDYLRLIRGFFED